MINILIIKRTKQGSLYQDNDGVWEEYGVVGGRRMPLDGGLSGMDKTGLHGCHNMKNCLGPEQGPETNDACEDTHARTLVLLFVCMSK